MARHILRVLLFAMLVPLGTSGCAPTTKPLRIEPGRTPAVTQFSQLRLAPGTDVIVSLISGENIRGKVKDLRPTTVDLTVQTGTGEVTLRTLAEPDIQTIARVIALSKGTRTRLGAVIGAAVTLPFGISMVGDMIVPGAIAGAFIGRATGDSRGEIVYERAAQRP